VLLIPREGIAPHARILTDSRGGLADVPGGLADVPAGMADLRPTVADPGFPGRPRAAQGRPV